MKLIQLQIFLHYDCRTGYVWREIHDEPSLDQRLNFPHKPLRLLSDPFWSEENPRFGKAIEINLHRHGKSTTGKENA